MADTRGCWSLSEAWGEKSTNSWVPVRQVWMPNDGFGYSMWKTTSRLTRTNINTGIAYHSTGDQVYSPASHGNTSLSSGDKGYFCGSTPTSGTSWVSKITYATGVHEDSYYSPGGPYMTAPGFAMGSFPADTKGYTFAGVVNGSSTNNTYKMTYSDETWSFVTSTIPWMIGGRWYVSGFNSGGGVGYAIDVNDAGYGQYGGGKFPFSTETWSSYPGPGSGANTVLFPRSGKSTADLCTKTHSYLMGGTNPSSPTYTTVTNKFTYSSETWARTPSADLIIGLNEAASYNYNSSKGALVGGIPTGASPYTNSQAYTLTFATDTWDGTSIAADADKFGAEDGYNSGVSAANNHSTSAGMDGFSRWMDGASETPDSGYAVSGRNSPSPQGHSTTSKIDFTSDTSSATPALDSYYSFSYNFGAGNTTNGYVIGGTDGSPSDGESGVTKITYSTETKSDLGGALGARRYACFAMTHGNTALYAGGGRNPDSSTIFKMNYSDETFAVLPTVAGAYTTMVPLRWNGASTATPTKGYFLAGNRLNNPHSAVGRLVFSNDTFENMTTTFPINTTKNRAISESTAAYSMGGRAGPYGYNQNDISTITKLTYSSETVANIPETLTSVRYNAFTMGNQTRGYVAGGESYSGGYHSKVEKFVYSTSTISAISSLPGNQSQGSGISPRNDNLFPEVISKTPTTTPTPSTFLTGPQGIKAEGYLIQGIQGSTTSPSGRSDVYRLDYSTDTWDSSVFATSTLKRKRAGAASNTTAAYAGGGGVLPADGNSTYGDMDKLTYATSTMSRIPGPAVGGPGGGIPGRATDAAAAGNQTQGYWTFGTGDQSGCDKLVYSTETAAALPNLPWNAKNTVAVSMQTHGYYGSGDGFDDKNSNFVKITFSNDSYAAYSGWFTQPGGFSARYRCGSSSSTKAYIVGGQNAPRCMDVTPWATNSTSNSPTTFLQSPGFYKASGQGSNEAGYFTGGGQVGNNGTTTEKITYSTDTTAILPGAYFPTSEPYGVNSYTTGGPNMNGLGTNVPNVI